MKRRPQIITEIKRQVLHESGYKCANPACRTILTLDIHHLDYVSESGSNQPDNLIALCPNCHTLHHKGHIPKESLRSWKMFLLSLNKGLDKHSIDLLLALYKVEHLMVSGEGVLECSALIAADLVKVATDSKGGLFIAGVQYEEKYWVELSEKGRSLVEAWKRGDQEGAVIAMMTFERQNENKKRL
ncbi:HNH endonuclease [Candidatus Acetothermia bacterium]|jgi:hypothetical protein|nr:HNH endonuclease [Candidatus Acetothermia bacterium]MCI2428392.1 HNH endonuclease [Candidatus Acetothermia bacterium]